MNPRRPRTAVRSSALPSLAALLAGGVAVEGCAHPAEAPDRRQRLTTHGESAASAFQDGRVVDGLREVAIGLGLIAEPARVEPDIAPAGAMPVTSPEPPVMPSGAIAPVQPTPPEPPVQHRPGEMQRIDPTPPAPPPVVHHTPPHPHPAVPGGMRRVDPGPR